MGTLIGFYLLVLTMAATYAIIYFADRPYLGNKILARVALLIIFWPLTVALGVPVLVVYGLFWLFREAFRTSDND